MSFHQQFNFFSTRSLQVKLMVPLLATTVVIMSAVGFFQYESSSKDIEKVIHSKAENINGLLANISAAFIMNFDMMALEKFVEQTMKDNEIVYIVFYDDKGKPLTEKIKKPTDVSSFLNISDEIKVDDKAIGKVEVGFRMDFVRQARMHSFNMSMGGTLVAVFLIFAITWFVTRNVTFSVTDISNELALTGQNLLEVAQEMSSSSDEMTAASTNQAAFVEKTASTIAEFDTGLERTNQNAQKSATVAKESEASALKGKSVVHELLASFDLINTANTKLNEHINNNLKNINDVVKVIERIGDQTQVINNIVFQTKLLSFNASVEAARAGEHGRGFAIVAEEVRKLAEMSGEAAKQITSLLTASIQQATTLAQKSQGEMSATTKETTSRINVGAERVQKAREAFDEISRNISSTSSISDEIARAVYEQAQGIQEINHAMNELSSSIQQTRVVSEKQSNLANDLLMKSEQIGRTTVNLKGLVKGTDHSLIGTEFQETDQNNDRNEVRNKKSKKHNKAA